MAIHELVLEDGEIRFRCNAKPENGNSPPCWWSYEYDEDGNEISSEDLGECNAAIWYGEDGFAPDAEICIPVGFYWGGENGPILTQVDEVAGSSFEPCHPLRLSESPDVTTKGCFIADGRIVDKRVPYHMVESKE